MGRDPNPRRIVVTGEEFNIEWQAIMIKHTAREWISIEEAGVYIRPAGVYIDPLRPVERALITHGHADHARPGHRNVLATRQTLDIMRLRYGDQGGDHQEEAEYGRSIHMGGVDITFYPAGHVLGSAQILLEYQNQRVVFSGDYKRRPDPTCEAFEPVPCDVFVTEATFGIPVFRHPATGDEIARLLASLELFPGRPHMIGCYPLGKTQRILAEIRQAGYDRPVYIHGALAKLTGFYQDNGVELGDIRHVGGVSRAELNGEIVICPPSGLADKWSRKFSDPVISMASGWMRIKQRAKQRGVELPMVISDHADWDELTATIDELEPEEVWVTHGREDALVHYCRQKGLEAQALSLIGYEGEEEIEEGVEPQPVDEKGGE